MSMTKANMDKQTIGRHTKAVFIDSGKQAVPAKVDTGADSSAVWASKLYIDDDGALHFVLFDEKSPYYTGKEIIRKRYTVKMVRSSNGHEQIRYSVKLRVTIEDRRFLASFTLANRANNAFPVLVGSRLLKGKFIVDVARGTIEDAPKKMSVTLTQLAKDDPKKFFEHHYSTQTIDKQKER